MSIIKERELIRGDITLNSYYYIINNGGLFFCEDHFYGFHKTILSLLEHVKQVFSVLLSNLNIKFEENIEYDTSNELHLFIRMIINDEEYKVEVSCYQDKYYENIYAIDIDYIVRILLLYNTTYNIYNHFKSMDSESRSFVIAPKNIINKAMLNNAINDKLFISTHPFFELLKNPLFYQNFTQLNETRSICQLNFENNIDLNKILDESIFVNELNIFLLNTIKTDFEYPLSAAAIVKKEYSSLRGYEKKFDAYILLISSVKSSDGIYVDSNGSIYFQNKLSDMILLLGILKKYNQESLTIDYFYQSISSGTIISNNIDFLEQRLKNALIELWQKYNISISSC
jgi:hypothetical protein